MKKILLLLGIICVSGVVSAQSDVHYSMFKLNRQIFNPAVTGANQSLTMTSHFRDQWGNFPGAPRTGTFQIHSPFFQNRVGIGISFIAEEIGMIKSNTLSGAYAYHIELTDNSFLRFGIQGQLEHGRIRWGMAKAVDMQDVTLGESANQFKGNLGAGVFYEVGEFYVGVSVPRFFRPNLYGEDPQAVFDILNMRTYYFQMGTAFRLNDNLALEPGLLIAHNPAAPFEFDFNVNLLMFDRLGLGVAYRLQDSADGIVQFKINNQFKIAAGIDFTLSGLQENAPTSFELLLQYEMNYEDKGIHNIRFF